MGRPPVKYRIQRNVAVIKGVRYESLKYHEEGVYYGSISAKDFGQYMKERWSKKPKNQSTQKEPRENSATKVGSHPKVLNVTWKRGNEGE